MTTENNETRTPNGTKPAGKGDWGKWVAVGAVAAMLVGGAGIASAISDDSGRGYTKLGFDQSERMGQRHGGFMHAGFGFGGHRVERVLEDAGVSDEQVDQLWEIADSARDELRPMMREFRGMRDDMTAILSAETIDLQALETLRAERVAALDAASKKMTDTLVKAAEVLTPEQRTKLVEHFKDRGMRGRW